MKPFEDFTSHVVPLVEDDIDTDQIIPARFLKGTSREGFGRALFADWRAARGAEFPLERPESAGARVLVAGANFGCGSSREHAPWALTDHGFRAVVARSFADIFRNNALKNGLLPVALDEGAHARLVAAVTRDPRATVGVELRAQTLVLPGGERVRFPLDGFSKHCLATGVDEVGYLLSFDADIRAFEAHHDAPT